MKLATQVRPDIEEGADLEQGLAALETPSDAAKNTETSARLDYFIKEDGQVFAGRHLLVDLFDASNLDQLEFIENTLVAAAEAAGATVLNTDFHHFQPNGGVSGVVVLSESHISIHTWPEANFAAVDMFMCGACNPHDSVPTLVEAFAPGRTDVQEIRRGRMPRHMGDAGTRKTASSFLYAAE